MPEYETQGYGDTRFNVLEYVHLFILAIGFFVFWFFFVNTTAAQEALVFFGLGTFALFSVLLFIVLKNMGLKIGIPLADKPKFLNRKVLYILAISMFFLTFFGMFISKGATAGTYAIQSKSFSVINPGFGGGTIIDIFAVLFENYAFFISFATIVFTVGYFLPKLWAGRSYKGSSALGYAFLILLVPLGFMTYHMSVYGFENIMGSITTFAFGMEMVVMGLITQDIMWAHCRHLGNNLGINMAKSFGSMDSFGIALMVNPITWVLIIITGIILFLRLRRKKQ